jgi:hypothetical protein
MEESTCGFMFMLEYLEQMVSWNENLCVQLITLIPLMFAQVKRLLMFPLV